MLILVMVNNLSARFSGRELGLDGCCHLSPSLLSAKFFFKLSLFFRGHQLIFGEHIRVIVIEAKFLCVYPHNRFLLSGYFPQLLASEFLTQHRFAPVAYSAQLKSH
jgi:hypothetical protein